MARPKREEFEEDEEEKEETNDEEDDKEEVKPEVKKDIKAINQADFIEVPTQTAICYKLENGEVVDEKGMLLRLYNKILRIEKSLC